MQEYNPLEKAKSIMKFLELIICCIVLSSCDIAWEHEIPGTKYTLINSDLMTLERNPPTNESIDWEFTHVAGVYYNSEYIIGFQCSNIDVYCYFIIHLNALPGGGDVQMTFNNKNDYIAARDSLGLSESEMELIQLVAPY